MSRLVSNYKDYLVERKVFLDEIVAKGGWNGVSVTDEEKYSFINYFLKDSSLTEAENNTAKVTFLMGRGDTFNDLDKAVLYLQNAFAEHQPKNIESCRERANSSALNRAVLVYLNEEDATDFTETAQGLFNLYINHGRKGSNDNSKRDGLFDFIESTSSYVTMGLEQQGYVLLKGTWNDLRTAIMDVLRNGNY